MKIKRIKLKEMISCGTGTVIPSNPVRPECTIEVHKYGVMIYNSRTDEHILTPWENIVEVVVEDPKAK